MSRVTKMEGLHLINFDPTLVMADNSAILEYNRLRKKYRPDLQLLPTTESFNNKINKVEDVTWSVSKDILAAQSEELNYWDFKGLPNADGISCYANTSIQCIFSCLDVRKILIQQREIDVLKDLFNQYISSNKVNVKAFCEYVNVKYTELIQQDVSEFLLDLCNKFSVLSKVFQHRVSIIIRCPGCDNRSNPDNNCNYILSLILPENSKTYTLQEIFEYNVGNWHEIEDTCLNNCKFKKLMKTEVSINSNIFIAQLLLFTSKNGKVSKINNFKIKDVPKAKILINNISYKLTCGIFHHGHTIDSGHYTTMIRKDGHWIRINDNFIDQKSWPKCAKDLYVMFLEKQF